MKRKARKNRNKNIGKVMTGLLLGGVVGAAIGWLTAPSSGEEMRRRLRGEMMSAREKAKTAVENVESKARELASEMSENVAAMGESTPRRRKVTSIGS